MYLSIGVFLAKVILIILCKMPLFNFCSRQMMDVNLSPYFIIDLRTVTTHDDQADNDTLANRQHLILCLILVYITQFLFLSVFSFSEFLPTCFSEMEFPDLGEHCSEKTCKRLGQ